MTKSAAKTGVGPMVMVAIEQHFPENQRITEDALARLIVPFGMRGFVWLMRPSLARDWMVRGSEKTIPGIWGALMCRKRYIDVKVVESLGCIDAVVDPGADLDTRSFRLPALADISIWEVDQLESIEQKRARLRKLFGVDRAGSLRSQRSRSALRGLKMTAIVVGVLCLFWKIPSFGLSLGCLALLRVSPWSAE